MELHLIDSPAVSIVGAQDWRIPIRQGAELEGPSSYVRTESRELVESPVARFSFDGFAQHAVLLEQVVVLKRRNLVQNLMGSAPGLNDRH
jgi:hypothetical protein